MATATAAVLRAAVGRVCVCAVYVCGGEVGVRYGCMAYMVVRLSVYMGVLCMCSVCGGEMGVWIYGVHGYVWSRMVNLLTADIDFFALALAAIFG